MDASVRHPQCRTSKSFHCIGQASLELPVRRAGGHGAHHAARTAASSGSNAVYAEILSASALFWDATGITDAYDVNDAGIPICAADVRAADGGFGDYYHATARKCRISCKSAIWEVTQKIQIPAIKPPFLLKKVVLFFPILKRHVACCG